MDSPPLSHAKTPMRRLELRKWSAPDGREYQVSIQEFRVDTSGHARRLKRIEFESQDGRTVGSTAFPGYLTLDLISPHEFEGLWNEAVGE